ncbi:MAG TPA: UDP-N-acetylmuramoyl-L-alanine--D-glutamate ligase [Nitrospirae bacterium]|nr:UDP-N-acetylmuramoylalanine--D-glutamate ligase [bacterium BMS3Abin10]GBE40023.1 UDP-N-acetylmuramoylalanine--D-glutamate ligase [bacterium BMS3Bbin08]HDH50042.1 UDP-N-acetylmuramoyl-L-alanine--D-glutamate ligase [Nitrospirota bacterium]HDK41459.1 UDP-N-acetylmuramoyl-L-alanine--D-glutamate ligase [Nitrospirota bacterium]HDK81116.1 UDP-N-acetylmuramoyl-L-alanine--D-glutamate ligase [Nitrospirota bacterium]
MMQITQIDNRMNKTLNKLFKNRKFLVVGLARSGTGAANLLALCGAEVLATDIRPRDQLEDSISGLSPSVRVLAGGHPEEIFYGVDEIVVSPGVPMSIQPLVNARQRGIPAIGELELAFRVISSSEVFAGLASRFIGVTGTNGKSTTTTLINRMLRETGFSTLLGGNIGNALTEEIYKLLKENNNRRNGYTEQTSPSPPMSVSPIKDYIVAEISSFQLESIQDFRPHIAVILNITPDHLDRYGSMQEYINAKKEIFKNQLPSDHLILNADDPVIMKLYNAGLKNVRVWFFSLKKEVDGIYYKDQSFHCSILSTPRTVPPSFLRKRERGTVSSLSQKLIPVSEMKIRGLHNYENAMAASLSAIIAGCPAESVRSALKEFPGLEHRLEPVCEINGVNFINDSKGTNTGAVARSLESFSNVVLIMGGREKGSDFPVLKDLIKKRVKVLVLFGEAKEKIARAVGDAAETIIAADLEEAVEISMSKASAGDTVLLSPGCTSFDMFADFEERGRKFKTAVMEIKNAGTGD